MIEVGIFKEKLFTYFSAIYLVLLFCQNYTILVYSISSEEGFALFFIFQDICIIFFLQSDGYSLFTGQYTLCFCLKRHLHRFFGLWLDVSLFVHILILVTYSFLLSIKSFLDCTSRLHYLYFTHMFSLLYPMISYWNDMLNLW